MVEQQPVIQQQPIKEKKGSVLRIIVLIVIFLAVLGFIGYVWVSVSHPEWLESDDTPTQPTPQPQPDGETSGALRFVGILIVITLVIILIYLIFKGRNIPGNKSDVQKKPVKPDRAEDLFKENFILRNNIESIYDPKKKAYVPANDRAILIHDRLPYFHTPTGDNFLLIEAEVKEGSQQGIHTIVIPIDKGESIIKGGYYRIDTHTPKFQFNLHRNTFPMSSMIDKQDRLRLAEIERAQETGESMPSQISSPVTPPLSGIPQIGTPLDAYGGEEGMGGLPLQPYTPPPRRRPYSRRRYSYRRY